MEVSQIIKSVSPSGKKIFSNVLDQFSGELVEYIETSRVNTDAQCRGVMFRKIDNTYCERVLKDNVIKTEWYNEFTDFNAVTNTGNSDSSMLSTVVFEAPENSIIRLTRGKFYLLTDALSISDKNIEIDLNGATLYQGVNKSLIIYDPTFEFSNLPVQIASENVAVDDSPAVPMLKITPSAMPTGLKKGDIIKITSEDHIPGTRPVNGNISTRMGQFLVISKVETAFFYTATVPEEIDQYITGVKIHKPKNKTIKIYGGNISSISNTDSSNWTEDLIIIKNAISPEVHSLNSLLSWSGIVRPAGCFNPIVTDCKFQKANTKDPLAHGYGIRDCGSQYGVYNNIIGIDVRHVYTTNSVTISKLEQIEYFGRSMFSNISNVFGYNCSSAPIDTHEGAYGLTFDNCHAFDTYTGNSSTGDGFSVRGWNITYRNCSSKARYGVHIANQFAGTVKNIRFENCDFSGYIFGLRTDTNTTNEPLSLNVVFDGGSISGGERTTSIRTAQIKFRNVDLICTGLDSKAYFISPVASEIECENCTFINNSTSSMTMRIVNFEGDENSVVLRGGYLRFKKTIDILVAATNFNGSVIVDDVETNRPISLVSVDAANLSKFTYNYHHKSATVNKSSSEVVQSFTNDTTPLAILGLNSESLTVRATIDANRTIPSIPNGIFDGQKLWIYNTSSTNTISIPTGGNLFLVGNITIPPRGVVLLRWWVNVWEQQSIVSYASQAESRTGGFINKVLTTETGQPKISLNNSSAPFVGDAELNSSYPTAGVGFTVFFPSLTYGKIIAIKQTSSSNGSWLITFEKNHYEDNSSTPPQNSTSLNQKFINAPIGFSVLASGINPPIMFIKTGSGNWVSQPLNLV